MKPILFLGWLVFFLLSASACDDTEINDFLDGDKAADGDSASEQESDGDSATTDGDDTTPDGDVTPTDGDVTPTDGDVTPTDGDVTPTDGDVTPTDGDVTPTDGDVTPTDGDVTPTDGDVTPTDGDVTPTDGDVTPTDGDVMEQEQTDGDSSVEKCSTDAECSPDKFCDPCIYSKEGECVPGCREHSCPTEMIAECRMVRPECGQGNVAILHDESGMVCWECVEIETCHPVVIHPDHSCDDGTKPDCKMEPPKCTDGEILAYQEQCYACVNPATCHPWGTPECKNNEDCPAGEVCDKCGSSSCPICDDCVAACVWGIPGRDPKCDDGTEAVCLLPIPECNKSEILAVQESCFVCVNPATCNPWGEAGCTSDLECPADSVCDDCGTSSCPECENCLGACKPHGCRTQEKPECNGLRPDCLFGEIAVVRDGCWVCVDARSCLEERTMRDMHCDDGTVPLCEMMPPNCNESEILAYQDHCYRCVNPTSCKPWGEPGCTKDRDCSAAYRCDECGTSSGPDLLDCVPACVVHGCSTDAQAACDMARPNCRPGSVSVVRSGCWVCVGLNACQAVDPEHDPRCDDGTQDTCDMKPPICSESEIFAYQDHCYLCVNPISCAPWGTAGCESDKDCHFSQQCDSCATSSCPMCSDCVAACVLKN